MDDPKDDVQGPAHDDEDTQPQEGAAGEGQADMAGQDMGQEAGSADTQEPLADGSPDADTPRARRRSAQPMVAPSVAAALEAQWAGRPLQFEPIRYLVLSVPEDPDARAWIEFLTGRRPKGLVAAWDEAQRASDRTMVGRIARPVVALQPWAYRWRVLRVTSGSLSLGEVADFANPRDALRAARKRFGELLRPDSLADDIAAIARTIALIHADDDDETGEDVAGPAVDDGSEPDPDLDQAPSTPDDTDGADS